MIFFKKSTILFSIFISLFVLNCQNKSKAQKDTFQLKFALEEIQGSVQYKYAEKFKDLLTKKSKNFDVKVYPYGTLGTSDQITELVQNGTLQIAMASPGHLGKLIPETQAFLLHFIFSEDQEVNKKALSEGKAFQLLDQLYKEKGMKLLSIFPEGWQVWTANKAIRSPKEMQGVKMRVMTSPLLVESYRLYGANPTPMPYSEVYSGLQLKMIDAQVNPVFAIEEMSFYEVNDHLIFPKHSLFVTSVVMNLKTYESLNSKQKTTLNEVVDQLNDYIFQVQSELNEKRLAKMKSKKSDIKLIHLSDEEREAFKKASLKAREKFKEMTGESGEKILNALLKDIQKHSQENISQKE